MKMGLWDRWFEQFFQQYGEKWYAMGECTLKQSLELWSKGNNNIKIVTGEADPDLYNRIDVSQKFDELLSNKITIELVFHKYDDEEEAISDLLRKNNRLVALKEKYPDFLKLYWQESRAPVHFTVVDSSHILMEDIHDAYKPRRVLIKYKTQLLGERWNERFEDLKKNELHEITIDKLVKLRKKKEN